jgi:xanthine dehydrogenase/oxidase
MEFTNAVIFYVNGKRISLTNPSPVLVLVDFLRCDLGLRGTKVACGEGGCGSCTVTVTKKSCSGGIHHFAVNACTTKICSLHLTSVTTIEGLGSAGDDETQIHPVQERIYKTHGSQCGFCTPGMVMSMSTELREKKGEIPDIEDVKKCLQGNLCRCTGYRPILQGFETFCNPRDKNNQTKIETSEELLDSKEVEFKEYSREADPPVPKEILQTTLASKILMLIDSSDCAWYQPTNEKQLIQLQKTLPEYRLLGGDTGWYQQPKRSEKSPVATIQLCAVDKLKKIFSESDGSIHIGSAVTLSAMEKFLKDLTSKNATVCAIIKALETLASPQVRNVATVGGNAMWDHPCSDLMTVYMATGCKLKIQCKNGSRLLDFDGDFLTKRIKPGRILTEVVLPPPVSGQRVSFFRKARRAEFDLAIANACFYVEEDDKGVFTDVKIAFGGAESLFKETKGKQVFAAR